MKAPRKKGSLCNEEELLILAIAEEEKSLCKLLMAQTAGLESLCAIPCYTKEMMKWNQSSDRMIKAILKKERLLLSALETVLQLFPCKVCREYEEACRCEEEFHPESWDEE